MIIDGTDNADYFMYRFNISKKDEKRFKLIKEFSYEIDEGVEVIGRIIKDSITTFTTMKKTKINNTNQIYYEFELKIINTDNILINIIKTIQALFLSKAPLASTRISTSSAVKLARINRNNCNSFSKSIAPIFSLIHENPCANFSSICCFILIFIYLFF